MTAFAADSVGSEDSVCVDRAVHVLGMSADDVIEWLGSAMPKTRIRTANKIIDDAAGRLPGTEGTGHVPLRVAHDILSNGSLNDDPVSIRYHGGLLSAARTDTGLDDRASVWVAVLAGMSTVQMRVHYLLYTAWAQAVSARPHLRLSKFRDRCLLYVDVSELLSLTADHLPTASTRSLMNHIVDGLTRSELITAADWGYGPAETFPTENWSHDEPTDLPYDRALRCLPTSAGIDLWGWSNGYSRADSTSFAAIAKLSKIDISLPQLSSVRLPKIDQPYAVENPPH